MSEREIRARLRIKRENIDTGWRTILADPKMRAALWELYEQCMMERDIVRDATGRASIPDTMRGLGKRAIGDWISNRAMLADHRNWLLLLAEHERPVDDGRREDEIRQEQEETEE